MVLEIGSGTVAGALFMKRKNAVPLIIGTVRRDFPLRDTVSGETMNRDLLEAIDDTCLSLQKTFSGRPSKIYAVLAAPWAHGEIRKISYEGKKDFRFTEKLGLKMMQTEMDRIKNEEKKEMLIDHRVIKVLLNGFPAEHPNDKKCRTAIVEGFFSFAPLVLISEIRDRVHKTWKARVVFSGEMLADFVAMRDIAPDVHGMMILDIGAEATELLFMKHDHITGTATFPSGENTVIREAGKLMGKSAVETKSLFSLYLNGSLEDESRAKVEIAFASARSGWQESLKNVMGGLSPGRHVPSEIFFSPTGLVSGYLARSITHEFFPEFISLAKNYHVIIIDMKSLHGFIEFQQGAMRDPSIAMKAIFINHSNNE